MTTTVPRPRHPWRTTLTRRAFVVHDLQMIAAMGIGMAASMPVTMLDGDAATVELRLVLMATSMTAGMAAWMTFRRHSWRATAEMAVVMYLAFAVPLPLVWAGVLSEEALLVIGHVLMFPAMAIAMLRRSGEYLGH